jgi:macrodomain Ter protein organizer (MatP/YcbG family)
MDTKLTLKLEQAVIEKAKAFAKKNSTSLSELFENYLQNIVAKKEKKENNITPLVKSLSGIIDMNEIDNHKDKYADFLINKYK